MPVAVTLVLMVFWFAVAYRRYEAHDLMLAGVFALVGVVITIYRLRASAARSK